MWSLYEIVTIFFLSRSWNPIRWPESWLASGKVRILGRNGTHKLVLEATVHLISNIYTHNFTVNGLCVATAHYVPTNLKSPAMPEVHISMKPVKNYILFMNITMVPCKKVITRFFIIFQERHDSCFGALCYFSQFLVQKTCNIFTIRYAVWISL